MILDYRNPKIQELHTKTILTQLSIYNRDLQEDKLAIFDAVDTAEQILAHDNDSQARGAHVLLRAGICHAELVDIEKEKARLTAEIERIDGEILRAESKLSNANFVNKAPAKLVDAEREKVKKYQDMKAKCVAQLESL